MPKKCCEKCFWSVCLGNPRAYNTLLGTRDSEQSLGHLSARAQRPLALNGRRARNPRAVEASATYPQRWLPLHKPSSHGSLTTLTCISHFFARPAFRTTDQQESKRQHCSQEQSMATTLQLIMPPDHDNLIGHMIKCSSTGTQERVLMQRELPAVSGVFERTSKKTCAKEIKALQISQTQITTRQKYSAEAWSEAF